MNKPSSRPPPSDRRRARRSLVELTAVASRAVHDGLSMAPQGPTAAGIDRAPPRELAAEILPVSEARVSVPEAAKGELDAPESTAELAVKIAKEFQARALEDFRVSMNAALDHAKDLVDTRAPANGASTVHPKRDDHLLTGLEAAGQYRAESLELLKANVETTLDYARDLAHARTPAEFVELSSEHARRQCEFVLKQTGALKSFARAVTKSDR